MILLLWFYHPALNKVHEILKKAHRHTMCLPRLSVVLPSPPQVALPNPKTLKDHLARSKLKILVDFNFEPSFKLRWCRARDLFGSQIPVTTGGFELRISCIRNSYLTHKAIRHTI